MTRTNRMLIVVVIAVLTAFTTLLAFAQTPTPEPTAEPAIEWPHGIISQVLTALLPVLLAGIAWLGKRVDAWIAQKTDNAMLEGLLRWTDDLVFSAVKEIAQTVVPAYRAASSDGKLSKDEAAELRKLAVDTIRKRMGMKGLAGAAKLGITGDALDQFLGSRVESAVHDLKQADRLMHLNGKEPIHAGE